MRLAPIQKSTQKEGRRAGQREDHGEQDQRSFPAARRAQREGGEASQMLQAIPRLVSDRRQGCLDIGQEPRDIPRQCVQFLHEKDKEEGCQRPRNCPPEALVEYLVVTSLLLLLFIIRRNNAH